MSATKVSLVCASLIFVSGSAGSQPAPVTRPAPPLRPQPVGPAHEIVIYRDSNFSGPAVSIPHDEPNLRLVWTVNSARVHSGTWQLCERANYKGICFTLSSDSRNLGRRKVQSIRFANSGGGGWRTLGGADINRIGWVNRTISIAGHQNLQQVRLCAERAQLRLHDARVRFSTGFVQVLHMPSQIAGGSCTAPSFLTGLNRSLSSIDVVAATVGITVNQGRIRVEGR